MKYSLLALIALIGSNAPLTANADSTIYKCIASGKTIYSESPCKVGTTKQQKMEIENEYMGNVTPDRQTIEQARARIRAGMQQSAIGVSTSMKQRSNDSNCLNLEQTIKNLNARARQPISAWEQDYLKEEKVKVQKQINDWKC